MKSLWNLTTKTPKKSNFPTQLSGDDYAVIKLKKFNNLQVAILVDHNNGGIAVSYEDAHLDAGTKQEVAKEINAIISDEIDKIIMGD